MNNFDLSEELAISNMIKLLENKELSNALTGDALYAISQVVIKHIYNNATKMAKLNTVQKTDHSVQKDILESDDRPTFNI